MALCGFMWPLAISSGKISRVTRRINIVDWKQIRRIKLTHNLGFRVEVLKTRAEIFSQFRAARVKIQIQFCAGGLQNLCMSSQRERFALTVECARNAVQAEPRARTKYLGQPTWNR